MRPAVHVNALSEVVHKRIKWRAFFGLVREDLLHGGLSGLDVEGGEFDCPQLRRVLLLNLQQIDRRLFILNQ